MPTASERKITALEDQLAKARSYTYLWYRIACKLAGRAAVDAEFERLFGSATSEGMAIVADEAEDAPRILRLESSGQLILPS